MLNVTVRRRSPSYSIQIPNVLPTKFGDVQLRLVNTNLSKSKMKSNVKKLGRILIPVRTVNHLIKFESNKYYCSSFGWIDFILSGSSFFKDNILVQIILFRYVTDRTFWCSLRIPCRQTFCSGEHLVAWPFSFEI